ncbi:MAG TPA: hypothetical protein GX693_02170 [Firmicutes bacterium]|nr:hypothetical protein [Bacillota bacterium]
MKKQYGITVEEALTLGVVNRLNVVGGSDGLNRVIKLVNVIEAPDIMDWVLEGEFLLTTGYSFREFPELMTMLITKMAQANSSGLAIKPKRFIKEIPSDLIASANRYGIPLLEVPYDLSFSEIIAPILGVITSKQNQVLQKLEQGNRKLTEMMLHGSTLNDLCYETSMLIHNPVGIMDREGKLYVSPLCPNKDQFELFFSKDSIEIKNEKLRFGNIKEVKYSMESTSKESTSEKDRPNTLQAVRIPIVADKSDYGHIYSIINNPISEPDILLLERAATIAALDFTKRKAIFEIEKNYHNEFLEILLSYDSENEEEIIKRARKFNLDLQKPTAVIIINDQWETSDLDQIPPSLKGINEQTAKEQLLTVIHSFRGLPDYNHLFVGIKGAYIIIVAQLSEDNPNGNLKDIVSNLLNFLTAEDRFKNNHQIKIGVGRPSNSIGNIKQSYREAWEALRVGLLSKKSSVIYFEDLGFFKILSEKSGPELNKFVEELLHPVLEYDHQKNGELIKTLQTYFETNRNFKLTSQKMFTHYNTILYRIKKIEQLTGISLDNPEDSLNVEIAINIHKLLRSSRGSQ